MRRALFFVSDFLVVVLFFKFLFFFFGNLNGHNHGVFFIKAFFKSLHGKPVGGVTLLGKSSEVFTALVLAECFVVLGKPVATVN